MQNKYLRIKEIGKIITGKTPPTSNNLNFGDEYPFITPTDIKSFSDKYLAFTERGISKYGANILKRNILPPKSICALVNKNWTQLQ